MKIFFLTNQVDIGGIEQNIVRLTSSLHARGHQVTVLSRGGALVTHIEAAGGRHLSLTPAGRRWLREVQIVQRWLREDAPDVIHVFSASMNIRLQLALFALRRRPKVVSSIMGLQTDPSERGWKIMLRAFLTCVGVDRLIVMAPAIADVVRRLPIGEEKIARMSVVGVDMPTETAASARAWARAELGVKQQEKLVMTVGRLDRSKSHELFISAAAQVSKTRSDVVFALVGGGSLLDELQQQVPAQFSERIRLVGARTDAHRLLAGCDICVRPGVVEGFIGITVLEAQAWGIPVVAFETQDVKLAVTHGVTGWLVPPSDVNSLAAAICHLLDHPEEAEAIGQAGREFVEKKYSIGAVSAALENLYGTLLAGCS